MIKLGYYNVYAPYAILYHYESKTRGYDDTEEEKSRIKKELDYLINKWGQMFKIDFAYNINLSSGDCLKFPEEFFDFLISDNEDNIKLFDVTYA